MIRKEFDEFKYYNIREDLDVFKAEHPIINSTPNKDSPNYIILTWNKIFMVEEIINLNPFNTNYFGWIDFGIANVIRNDVPENILETLKPTTEKIKILELRTVFGKELEDIYEYTKAFRWKCGGGMISGHKNNMIKFISLFREQMHKFLYQRIFAHEETIMALVLYHNRDLFETYFGHYFQILINYDKLNKPVELIFENMRNCRFNQDYKNGYRIAEKLYNDCFDKLTPEKKFNVYDELLVNGFYYDKKDLLFYGAKLVEDLENNPDLRIEFMKDKDRNINNLSFINTELTERVKKLF